MSANLKLSSKAIAAFSRGGTRVDAEVGSVLLYGVVGWEFNLASVMADTKDLPAGSVIQIQSPGGDAHEGLAIYEALKGRGFVVKITGICASAASLIAMAGERIVMTSGAQLMIHNPWTMTEGDGDAHRAAIEVLDKMKASYAEIYAERTGLPREQIDAVMDSETFWSAQEVAKLGFGEIAATKSAAALSLAIESAYVLNR